MCGDRGQDRGRDSGWDAGAEGASERVEDQGTRSRDADPSLLDDLVAANRILFRNGVVDAFGHVSVRHDKTPERYLLSRNMAPGLVTHDDIVEFDLQGTAIDARGRGVYLERFLHGQIYRSRPDIRAIVHSHAPELLPFSIVRGAAMTPVWHMSGFLGDDVPVFEIRDHAGLESDMLIRDNGLGHALAQSLGGAAVVLMRGHGATVVGDSLPQAVFRAIYTMRNAEVLLRALPLGPVTSLTSGEAAAAAAANDGQITRAWDLWKREARPSGQTERPGTA